MPSDAFDTAWALMKMPIVPNSLKEEGPSRYSARFQEIKAEIKHPADDTYNLGDRATSHIGQDKKLEDFFAFGTGVDEEYQRRGYATALYDMLARILHEQGDYKLTPSNGLNEKSRGLWGDKESWPVRDDL